MTVLSVFAFDYHLKQFYILVIKEHLYCQLFLMFLTSAGELFIIMFFNRTIKVKIQLSKFCFRLKWCRSIFRFRKNFVRLSVLEFRPSCAPGPPSTSSSTWPSRSRSTSRKELPFPPMISSTDFRYFSIQRLFNLNKLHICQLVVWFVQNVLHFLKIIYLKHNNVVYLICMQ